MKAKALIDFWTQKGRFTSGDAGCGTIVLLSLFVAAVYGLTDGGASGATPRYAGDTRADLCCASLVCVPLLLALAVVWQIRRARREPTADHEPGPPPLPLPPPAREPSRAERMADARARYEETLALLERSGLDPIELAAARRKAKYQYLNDIDREMGG